MGSKRLIVQTSKFPWKGENREFGYELTAEDLDGVGQNVINALISGGKLKYDEDDSAPKHDAVLAAQMDELGQSLALLHKKLDMVPAVVKGMAALAEAEAEANERAAADAAAAAPKE